MAPYSKHTFSSSLVQTECHQRLHPREQRRPPARQRPHVPETRRGRGGGGNPTLSTSTRSWSRFTQTLVYPARLCPSWTPLSTTSSSVSPLKQAGWHTTTEGVPLPPERSRPLSVCSSPENWPNMPCLREPRLWPSTPAPSKQSLLNTTKLGPFRTTTYFPKRNISEKLLSLLLSNPVCMLLLLKGPSLRSVLESS